MVLDAGDGHLLRQLHGYQLLASAGGALLLSWPVGADRTALGWVEPRAGRVRLLTTSTDRYQTCAVSPQRLACTTAAGALLVWGTDV
jgi:hypothetical protein